MKWFLSLCFWISMTLPIYAQNNISGTYYDEYGNFIEIDKNLMKLIRKETPGYPGALLAECSLKWIDKQFIELNSTPPIQIAHKGFEMIQFCDSTIMKDSVEVSFFLPYHDPLQIVVFTDNTYKSYDLNYSQNNRSIMLPKGTTSISLSISPGKYLPIHSADGLFYGILYLILNYNLEEKVNHIDLKFPAIDNSFFEMYYVKGEYARVWKDTITWKGIVYKKRE